MWPIKAIPRAWILLGAAIAIPLLTMELLWSGPMTYTWRKPSRAELDALVAEGDSIVRALHAYQNNHRQYPSEVPGSLDTSQGAKYGGWRYECAANCTRFLLSVADCRDHSFEVHWRFDSKTWYIDG